MKIKRSLGALIITASWWIVGWSAPVYMVHDIDGQAPGVDQSLPIDLYVDGLCIDGITSNIPLNGVVGPLNLPIGSYAVEVRLSTSPVCDDGPLAVSGDFEVNISNPTTVVAHLSSYGAPTLIEYVFQ